MLSHAQSPATHVYEALIALIRINSGIIPVDSTALSTRVDLRVSFQRRRRSPLNPRILLVPNLLAPSFESWHALVSAYVVRIDLRHEGASTRISAAAKDPGNAAIASVTPRTS